ncbi:MAG: TetR family transcriptional regulator [Myxococcaceae bacterium]
MELFRARGYTDTTVQEIATRAGLTERTFFRYFTDKREVLFWGAEALKKLVAEGVAAVPKTTPPLEAVVIAFEAVAPIFQQRREYAKARRALIAAHPELRERELIKLTLLASVAAEALRERSVLEPAASLAAEAGIAVFKIAFDRWIDDAKSGALSHHIRNSLDELKVVISGGGGGFSKVRAATATRRRVPRNLPVDE